MLKKLFPAAFILLTSIILTSAQALKYSADGKTMAINFPVTFSSDKLINQIIFFDTASGKIKSSVNVRELEYDKAKMMFAGNDQTFLIGDRSESAVIKITADNKTDQQEFESEIEDYDYPLIAMAFSADGKTMFKLHGNKLKAYNFTTQTVKPENGKIISADGEFEKDEFLAVQANGRILVEYRKKAKEHSLVVHDLTAKTSKIIKLPYDYEEKDTATFSAEISDNGERLALKCALSDKSQVTVYDLKKSEKIGEFSFPEREEEAETNFYSIDNFAISPDGKKIAVKIDEMFTDESDMLVLWDTMTKTENVVEVKHYSEEYFAKNVVFSPDSKHLAVSSEVLTPNSFSVKIQLFDANTGKYIRDF